MGLKGLRIIKEVHHSQAGRSESLSKKTACVFDVPKVDLPSEEEEA